MIYLLLTHIRKGSNLAWEHLNTIFIDQDNGMKEGGGKLIAISQRVNYHLWQPDVGAAWVNSEWAWVLVHNNSEH